MKRKLSLNLVLGRKSRIRYPHTIYLEKVEKLVLILPANAALAEPPVSTAIMMKKGDPFDFCDKFNEESYTYEEGFPLRVILLIMSPGSVFEIKSATTSSLRRL